MAFIILSDREQEWERRPLRQAITIGRSSDCELPVRDTLLSREHCRLEPHGNQWVLIDLKSRNGTRVGENLIKRHILQDGDVVRIGQTRLCFRAGAFVPGKVASPAQSRPRPLDPHEAMAATITGAVFVTPAPQPHVPGFPTPKPKPLQSDGADVLMGKMESGAWDSRLANQAPARRPAKTPAWLTELPDTMKWSPFGSTPTSATPRWIVITYIALAGAVFACSLCIIGWPEI